MKKPIVYATETAEALLAASRPHDDGGLYFPIQDADRNEVDEPWLFGGQGGVAYFLAEMARVAGDSKGRFERAAVRTGRRLLGIPPGEHGPYSGLHSGEAGLGLLALRLKRLSGRDDFFEWAHQRAVWVSKQFPQFTGLRYGASGAILFLLEMGLITGDNRYVKAASRQAAALIRLALPEDDFDGLCWDQGPGLPDQRGVANLGLADGTAGCGLALTALASQVDAEALRDSVERVARWLTERNVSEDSVTWPPNHPECQEEPRLDWSNGTAGVGMFLLQAARLLDDPELKTVSGRCIKAISPAIGELSEDATLATGLAGAGWLLLCHAQPGKRGGLFNRAGLGGSLPPTAAARVGMVIEPVLRVLLRLYQGDGRWHDDAMGYEPPGLMNGSAGVGLFFLNLARPISPPELLLGG